MLRDDGVSYGDYLEQITYLIFLKMAFEYSQPPYNRDVGIPEEYNWKSLTDRTGAELESHYLALLRDLSMRKGLLGQIFAKAQNKIQDPAKLSRLVAMIDETKWTRLGVDVKGDIYEGILEKNAEDTKSGAGQYFTPRALIQAIVECVRPQADTLIADPAAGTGGFLLAAYSYLEKHANLNTEQKARLKNGTFFGNEIVANTRRLCLMNLFLHGIGEMDGESPISSDDSLVAPSARKVDLVLANPPFGKKSSMTITNAEGEAETEDFVYNRQDFWATTSNKQVNFLQHIYTMLKNTGGQPWSCPIMCCLKATQAKSCVRSFCKLLTCIQFYVYRQVFSTQMVLRQMYCFLITVPHKSNRLPKKFGYMTTAPMCIIR